eukprot:gene1814-956_t
MDVIFQSCLQEISLFGYNGCTFSEMYDIIVGKYSNFSFDDFLKKKIFSLLKDENDVTMYEPYPENEIGELKFTKEGVLKFPNRVKLEKNELSFNEKIILVTSYEMRLSSLGISEAVRNLLSDIQYGLLEEIGKHRYEPSYQNILGKVLSIDPRNMNYHLKKLIGKNLITPTRSALINKVTTKITWLVKFQPLDPEKTEVEKVHQFKEETIEKILEMFKKNPKEVLLEVELKSQFQVPATKLGRSRWEGIKNELCKTGNVEQIVIEDSDDKNKSKRGLKWIQKEGEEEEDEEVEEVGYVQEVPIVYQIYHAVAESENGLTHKQIYGKFGISQKISSKLCADAEKLGLKVNTSEKHIFVTFPQKHGKKKVRKQKNDEEEEIEYVTSEEEEEEEVGGLNLTINESPKKTFSGEVSTSPSSADSSRVNIFSVGKSQTDANKKFEKKVKYSEKFYERADKMMEILTERKILSITDIRRDVGIEDSKTRDRVVKYLEEEGKLKDILLSYPSFRVGEKEIRCIILPDVDNSAESEEISGFVTSLRNSELKKKTNNTLPVSKGFTINHLDTEPIGRTRTTVSPSGKIEYISLRYGYLIAKMSRVKEFHKMLWALSSQCMSNEVFSFNRSDIFANMTIDSYLRIIGCGNEVPNLKNHLHTKINDMNPEIGNILFSTQIRTNVVLPRFDDFILTLEKLQLLRVSENKEILTLSKGYTLKDDVSQKTFSFSSVDDVEIFWNEFKDYCIGKTGVDFLVKPKEDEQDVSLTYKKDVLDKLLPDIDLSDPIHWSEIRKLSKNQIKMLHEYREKDPLPSCEKCLELRKKLRVPFDTIVLFFFRYHEHYPIHEAKRKIVLSESSTKKKKTDQKEKSKDMTESPTPVPPTDVNDVMEIEEDEKEDEEEIIRRKSWKPEEDIKLLELTASKLKKNERGVFDYSMVDWARISENFPEKSKKNCYSRWRHLIKYSYIRPVIEFVLEQKEVESEIDIHKILTESNILNEDNVIKIQLPKTLKEFNEKYITHTLEGQKTELKLNPKESLIYDFIKSIDLSASDEYSIEAAHTAFSAFVPLEIQQTIEKLKKHGYLSRNRSKDPLVKSRLHGEQRLKGIKVKTSQNYSHSVPDLLKNMQAGIKSFNEKVEKVNIHSTTPSDSLFYGFDIDPASNEFDSGNVASFLTMISNDKIKLTPFFTNEDDIPTTSTTSNDQDSSVSVLNHLTEIGAVKHTGVDFVSGKADQEGFALPDILISVNPVIDPTLIPKLNPVLNFRGDFTGESIDEITEQTKELLLPFCKDHEELLTLFHFISHLFDSISNPDLIEELKLIKEIYQQILESKKRGILKAELKKKYENFEKIQEVLTHLCNFDLIFEANSFDDKIYFSNLFGKCFKILPSSIEKQEVVDETVQENTEIRPISESVPKEKKFKKIVKFDEENSVPVNPFRNISTAKFNLKLIEERRISLIEKIYFNPGIRREDLLEHMIYLSPSDLDLLLDQLEFDGIIKKKIIVQKRSSLFCDEIEIFPSKEVIENDEYFSQISYECENNVLNKIIP